MKDQEIVDLFWERSETAISQVKGKYFRYCYSIALGILRNYEDAEECVNDTWVRAWNGIPPARPVMLRTFLGKITRNLSLNALEKMNAQKRGQGQVPLILSELEECISAPNSQPEDKLEGKEITQVINKFLSKLTAEHQKVFVRRYWYASSIEEISEAYSLSESKVKSILFRLRKKLKKELEKEGVIL